MGSRFELLLASVEDAHHQALRASVIDAESGWPGHPDRSGVTIRVDCRWPFSIGGY